MDIPSEFIVLVRNLNNDNLPVPFTEDEWISRAAQEFSEPQKAVIRHFLSEILTRKPSGKELQKIWAAGAPDYILTDEDLSKLLQIIVAKLQGTFAAL